MNTNKKSLGSLLIKSWPKILASIFFVILFGAYVNIFAVFTPGQTLDPNCAPGITGCIVNLNTIETDPAVGAINGLVKSNGSGAIGAVISGTDIKTINGSSLLGSGDIAISGGSSQWTTSGPDIYFNTGKIGIGTATPTSSLSVKGSAVIGTELVTNGTFDTDTTGWELGGGASYNAGKITTTGSGTPGGYSTTRTNLNINVENGKSYILTFTVSDIVGNNSTIWPGLTGIGASLPGIDTEGNYSAIFYSNYTGVARLTFQRWISALASSWSLDNVSIKEIDAKSPIEIVDYNNKKILSFGDNSTYNFFVGPDAGYGTSNLNSSFLGKNAGYEATDASWSNFFGEASGYQATYATDSNFLGEYSGYQATYAGGSNFIGYFSGYKAANVWGSNFIGEEAGNLAIDSSYSNFIGSYAGDKASNAGYSNFIGNEAGQNAANAWDSNFIGPGAGGDAINSAFANFFGYNAGYGAANAKNSIFIGQNAGQGDIVNNTGNNDDFSILIGKDTETGGFSNSIAIGGSAINTASNQLSFGSSLRPINKLYIAGLNYDLPTVQGAASSVLTNDGNGGLTWAAVGGGLLSDADFNTKGGTNAGLNLVTGAQYNTFLGYEAGKGAAVGGTNDADYNTAIGYQSLYSNTIGWNNTAVGYGSLLSNTEGFQNTAFGTSSLISNTTGYRNTATGDRSLRYNTTGGANTATGYTSLSDNTTGDANTANGNSSLQHNTTGVGNTASGNGSMFGNNTGSYNTASGYQSLISNMNGSNNTANGRESLSYNFTGSNGVAYGAYSMYQVNNTATPWTNYNTAIGYESMYGSYPAANNIGNYNTALGYQTLHDYSSANYNTALGYQAGYYISGGVTSNTTSDYSVYLGSGTKPLADDGQNEIVIGYNAIGNGSNTVTLGNSSVLRTYITGLNLKAGTATAGTAPLKFTAGTNLGTTEAGAMEYDGTHLYFTATNGGTRYQLDQQGGATDINGLTDAISDGSSIFLGSGTGAVDGGGNTNIGIGNSNLSSNISGYQNTAIGNDSLTYNSTGWRNTAVGRQTLTYNTDGYYNTANGYYSLINNTTGYSNTASGAQALSSNVTGNNNTVNGVSSLYHSGKQVTAGSFVVGVSYTIKTTGTTNFTLIGAANSNPGTIFTATGPGSGTGTASSNSSNNTALGYNSGTVVADGFTFLNAISNSLFLGAETKALSSGDSNEIVVGYNAVGRGSNKAQWGNTSITNHYFSGNVQLSTYGAGTLTTDASGNITASSDERLKDIQGDFNNNNDALSIISSINPILYKWNQTSGYDTDTIYAGFSAQNIKSVIPEAVGIDPRGYLTLSDRPILATVVNAVKELNLKIDEVSSLGENNSFKEKLITWLGDVNNGISNFVANTIRAKNQLCVGEGSEEVCITKDELLQMKNNLAPAQGGSNFVSSPSIVDSSSSEEVSNPEPSAEEGTTPAPSVEVPVVEDSSAQVTEPVAPSPEEEVPASNEAPSNPEPVTPSESPTEGSSI